MCVCVCVCVCCECVCVCVGGRCVRGLPFPRSSASSFSLYALQFALGLFSNYCFGENTAGRPDDDAASESRKTGFGSFLTSTHAHTTHTHKTRTHILCAASFFVYVWMAHGGVISNISRRPKQALCTHAHTHTHPHEHTHTHTHTHEHTRTHTHTHPILILGLIMQNPRRPRVVFLFACHSVLSNFTQIIICRLCVVPRTCKARVYYYGHCDCDNHPKQECFVFVGRHGLRRLLSCRDGKDPEQIC